MRNIRTTTLLLICLIMISSLTNVYAFSYASVITETNISINIGKGVFKTGILDLGELTPQELYEVVPSDTLFTYNGILYITNPNATYVPAWHGLPSNGSNQWAIFAMSLEWVPNSNYRNNSVVTRFGKYYITNTMFNNNWFIDDPATNSNEWLEIEEVSLSLFSTYLDTGFIDYRLDYSLVEFK